MNAFLSLDVHPDVRDGLAALRALGIRLVTLSNGSTAVADQLLASAGLRDHLESLLSVEQAGIWKPAAAAYQYALSVCGVEAEQAMLVAVHPWDVDGARAAGLRSCWVNRTGGPYPGYFEPAELEVDSLVTLAERLA